MDRVLTIFIYVWSALFVLVNLVGIVGQFYLRGFSGGLSYIQEIYSPFNIRNFIVSIVFLSPALGAYFWREKRRKKQPRMNRES